jgi:hypothetical protein
MIPKIIHFCWLSDDPYPPKIQKCIDSWKKFLPDYEFVHWNFKRFPRGKSKWVDQAFDNHQYAFAADYIRLYALYNYGGIYLDTDVEVVKPFDDLLDLPYFLGAEDTEAGVEPAAFGCEKGWKFLGELFKGYDGKSFIKEDGSFDQTPLPYIFRRYIDAMYEYHPIKSKNEFINDEGIINIFSVDYFSPKTHITHAIKKTNNTYCIHHFAGSWLAKPDNNRLRHNLNVAKFAIKHYIKHLTLLDKKVLLVSNSLLSSAFADTYSLSQATYLLNGTMSDEDYLNFVLSQDLSKSRFSNISRYDSKYEKHINEWYPIFRVEGTDIEMHFKKAISKKDVIEHLSLEQKLFSQKHVYYLFCSNDIEIIKKLKEKIENKLIVVSEIENGYSDFQVSNFSVLNDANPERKRLIINIANKLNRRFLGLEK